jgi:hypothetical protein
LYQSQDIVVASLVNFFDSTDYMVAIRAMESLLVVCQLDKKSWAQNTVKGTPLCWALKYRLSSIVNAVLHHVFICQRDLCELDGGSAPLATDLFGCDSLQGPAQASRLLLLAQLL